MTERETKADHRATAEKVVQEFDDKDWTANCLEDLRIAITEALESVAAWERKLGVIEGMRRAAEFACEVPEWDKESTGHHIEQEADRLEKELKDEKRRSRSRSPA
jgi:hypothetical protein